MKLSNIHYVFYATLWIVETVRLYTCTVIERYMYMPTFHEKLECMDVICVCSVRCFKMPWIAVQTLRFACDVDDDDNLTKFARLNNYTMTEEKKQKKIYMGAFTHFLLYHHHTIFLFTFLPHEFLSIFFINFGTRLSDLVRICIFNINQGTKVMQREYGKIIIKKKKRNNNVRIYLIVRYLLFSF